MNVNTEHKLFSAGMLLFGTTTSACLVLFAEGERKQGIYGSIGIAISVILFVFCYRKAEHIGRIVRLEQRNREHLAGKG